MFSDGPILGEKKCYTRLKDYYLEFMHAKTIIQSILKKRRKFIDFKTWIHVHVLHKILHTKKKKNHKIVYSTAFSSGSMLPYGTSSVGLAVSGG